MKKIIYPPEEAARKIIELIANASDYLFRDKKFRSLVLFDSLDQVEQDRIFNEIVVSANVASILMFATAGELSNGEKQDYYANLSVELESVYGNWLKELGVEAEFTEMWKKLIKLRVDEYKKDYQEHKKEIGGDKPPWVVIIAIGGHHHITRGKGKPDELFKMFNGWMNNLFPKIMKTVVKVTLF